MYILKSKFLNLLRQSKVILAPLLFLSFNTVNTQLQAAPQSQLSRTTFETTLKNGLKVIIREDHRSPIVMTQIWYGVGSSDESGNVLGISHVLEHMMFKGTKKVPDDEFEVGS